MDEFQKEVIDRLGRLETLLKGENGGGLISEIRANTKWRETHPRKCPFETTRTRLVTPVTVALVTALAVKAPEWIGRLISLVTQN